MQVDSGDPRIQPIAELLGLSYAAGRLARRWGLLPQSWSCSRVVARMWRTHVHRPTPYLSLDEEITAAAASPDAVHVGFGVPPVDPAAVAAAEIMVHHKKSGDCELWLRPKTAGRHVRGLGARRVSAEARSRLAKDGKHLVAKCRPIAGEPQERLYRFPLQAK